MTYGRRDLWLPDTEITPEDVPILPGESVTLKLREPFVKGYEAAREAQGRPDPKKVEFELQAIDFGDGTAFRYTDGTPVRRAPKKVSANEPRPKQQAASENASPPPGSAAKSGCSPSPAKFSRAFFLRRLALDRNGNGVIDSGRELFVNLTLQPAAAGRNGFIALARYDKPEQGGNADGVVDDRDAVFPRLRLWRDANHNGVSEAAELHPLPAFDVARLHLSYKESKRTDTHGNEFRYRARVDDARGAKVNRWAWDVFLVRGR